MPSQSNSAKTVSSRAEPGIAQASRPDSNSRPEPVHALGQLHAMTVDVEDYYQVSAFEKAIPRNDWEKWPSRVEDNTRRLLDLFDEQQISGTFFVLGWVAERHPQLVKDIAGRGHEIASHGYSHRLIYQQLPSDFRAETERSKQFLEDLVQHPVTGYRAASYSITRDSFWALDILAELGFEWDSSIFPVHHDRYGVPGSPFAPYHLRTPGGALLLEFPLTTAPLLGQRLPAAGGGYFRLYPYWLSRALLRRASRAGPAVFYLHPWEIDPGQPRVEHASWFSRFRHYNNLQHCEARLRRLTSDFRFGTVSAALASTTPLPPVDIQSV